VKLRDRIYVGCGEIVEEVEFSEKLAKVVSVV
jgi:hypothetical protein